MVRAKALKVQLASASSAQTDLVNAIHTDKAWSWADNPALLDNVRSSKNKVDVEKCKNAFWKDWLMMENWHTKDRKEYTSASLKKELDHVSVLETAISKMSSEVAMLKGMQDVRLKKTDAK